MYKVKFDGVYYVDAESEIDASDKVLKYLSEAVYKKWHDNNPPVLLSINESVNATEEYNELIKPEEAKYKNDKLFDEMKYNTTFKKNFPRRIGGHQRY